MHGVAPHRCDQVAGPLLGGDAGGRSPGVLSSRLGILDAVLKSNYSQIQLLQSHSLHTRSAVTASHPNDGNDVAGGRIDDQYFIADHDVVKAAPSGLMLMTSTGSG